MLLLTMIFAVPLFAQVFTRRLRTRTKAASHTNLAPAEEYPEDKCGYWYQTEGWDQYKKERDQCKWGPKIPAKEFFGDSFHTGQIWDGRPLLSTWNTPLEQDIFVQECMFEDPDPRRKGEFWTVRRFGPYFGQGAEHGGKEVWQNTKWHERFTQRFFTGRAFARYDAKTGEMIGSPPLHIHHEHVGYTEGLPDFVPLLSSFNVNRLAASHGEQYGLGEDGVLLNVYKALPLGLGKPMSHYTYDNKLADTRDEGATQLEWFQEVGFRTTPVKQREVYHMTRFNMGSLYKNFQVDVPKDSPSMFWSSWRMPASGEFITNWIHTHGLEKVIIFKGDPEKFGLKARYAKPDIWSMKKIQSTEMVREDLIRMADEAGIEWCEGTPQHEEVTDYPEHQSKVVHARITKICCLPWKFKKGEAAAMVGLYDGRKATTPPRQHFLFRGEYFLDEGVKEHLKEAEKEELLMQNLQFCGENPDTCIKNVSLGLKLSALLLYGGNVPEDTRFNQTAGYVVLVVLLCVLSTLIYSLYRCVWKRTGCSIKQWSARKEYLPLESHYSSLGELQMDKYGSLEHVHV